MENEIAEKKCCAAKNLITILDVNVDNIFISKWVKTKSDSKYLIKIKIEKAIRQLVLIMPKMKGYVKTFKVEDNNNRSTSFLIDNGKLLEKYKAIWTEIEGLKNVELNALENINFYSLNVSEDDTTC